MKIYHKAALKNPKVIIIAIVIVLVATGVGTWAAATNQWQAVASQAAQRSDEATSLKKQIVSSGTRDSHKEAITALSGLKPAGCEGNWWFAWQTAVWDGSKKAQKICKTANSRVVAMSGAATLLKQYLNDEMKITDQLASLVIDSKAKDWQIKAASASSSAYTELSSLKSNENTELVLKEALKRVKEIKDAWNALKTANAKKDRTAYESAVNRVDDAYAQLASITEVSDKELTTLVSSLEALK